MNMYGPLLLIHSWLRWVVLITTVYFAFKSVRGWWTRSAWTARDTHFVWAYSQLFGYQIVLGVTLWGAVSPITKAALKDWASARADETNSFWVLRHPVTMILALAVFHVGRAVARRGRADAQFRTYAITLAVVLLTIASAIPWPGLMYGRPLMRWLL